MSATPTPGGMSRTQPSILDVGFKYQEAVHTPTVLVGFAPNDWDARDAFVRALGRPSTQPTDDERWTIDRAADLLEHYAGFIYTVHPDDIECHPYLPELKYVAEQLRKWFPPSPQKQNSGDGNE